MHTNNIMCLNVSLQNMIAWWIRLCRRLHEHDIATKIYYVLFYQIDMNKLIASYIHILVLLLITKQST